MIRDFQVEDTDVVVKLCNDFTTAHPKWYPDPITPGETVFTPEKTVPFGPVSFAFVQEVGGKVLGFVKGGIGNQRCDIHLIVVDVGVVKKTRIRLFWELMLHLGEAALAKGCTHIQGVSSVNHTELLQLVSMWGTLDANRKVIENETGGVVIIEREITQYLLDCQAQLA